jgi:hypothetical protein
MRCGLGVGTANTNSGTSIQPIACDDKTGYIIPMHFSTHIATLHSTFSLLAALLLRGAR